MLMMRLMLLSAISLLLMSCEQMAVLTTPKKQPIISTNKLVTIAQTHFWQTLHQGRYNDIPATQRLLMAAYLQNPNDPTLAAHLGFIHIWKITERQRVNPVQPTIVDDIILAKKYFSDAVELNPNDARFLGFYGDSQLVTGKIFHDQREQTRGYFTLKRAIGQWPEFNYFTGGYVMSDLSSHSKYFKEAVDWQWATLDLCAGERVSRLNPDYSPYMKRETKEGPQRACWNSWIAPYNFEGFFMNMGDMLVKQGDWQTAIKIYKNARLDKSYANWPYRDMLEKRILNARENVSHFQQQYLGPDKTIMFNSGYGCMTCHQKAR